MRRMNWQIASMRSAKAWEDKMTRSRGEIVSPQSHEEHEGGNGLPQISAAKPLRAFGAQQAALVLLDRSMFCGFLVFCGAILLKLRASAAPRANIFLIPDPARAGH